MAETPGQPAKPWSGRFAEDTSPLVDAFTTSLAVDRRIALQDVRGSIAHARMLGRRGIIPEEDARLIVEGLEAVGAEIEEGSFRFDERLEDVHMNVEARLTQIIGPAAGRLHTARSRNDQVATDLRLWLKEAIAETIACLHELQVSLVETAAANRRVVMPGYTHLQRAQPVLLAHHLLAYFEMFERDIGRMADCYARADVLPWALAPWPAYLTPSTARWWRASSSSRRSAPTASMPCPTATSRSSTSPPPRSR